MNNTLCNGFKLLEYLAQSGDSHSVTQLAEVFDLPASHVCRLLKTLLDTGYIQQDRDRRYRISLRVLALSHSCLCSLTVRNVAHPHLFALHEQLGQRIYLALPLEGRALIVDVIYSENEDNSQSSPSIGRFNAVNYTASGKLCAAYADEKIVRRLLDEKLERHTARTICSAGELEKEFALIRKQRCAVSDGESSENSFSVAAPVFGSDGSLLAAVGTYRIAAKLSDAEKERLIAAAVRCANSISCDLLTAMRHV